MAAPMEGETSESETEQCEETDVFSPQFDALRALYDSNLQLPCPEAEPFRDILSFLNHYNSITDLGQVGTSNVKKPPTINPDENAKTSEQEQPKDATGRPNVRPSKSFTAKSGKQSGMLTSVSHAGPSGLQNQKTPGRRTQTVFNLMEDADGPLSLLKWCFEKKCKARVCTRTFKGLRSICIGYVVAFDKFYNLALSDVTEVYRKPPLGQTIYHQEVLTFSKILKQFSMPKKGNTETPKVKKSRNRKERKVRLEERLKSEGIFIENYHPPPEDRDTAHQETKTVQTISDIGDTNVEEGQVGQEKKEESLKTGESREESQREIKTDAPKKTGKDLIKPEEFHRRYVRQLFVRGDNIVLISVKKR
ncbi:hypothetical protein BSL78_29699 [Apostichopus japonicus]|uniref:U7 snRNA-associated Sm-like protein LSm11 n=1 Tax=Stichopus japonicus TaxID=307972 RepID=A0A2G8JCL6_STIJA|nr:hypothetical protein BSL78_29699 [Apostichopus japonicus]